MSTIPTLPPRMRPNLDEVASRPGAAIDDDPIDRLATPLPSAAPEPVPGAMRTDSEGPMLYSGGASPMTPPFVPTPPTPGTPLEPCTLCEKFSMVLNLTRSAPPNLMGAAYSFEDGDGVWMPWSGPDGAVNVTFSVSVSDLQDRYLAYRQEMGWAASPEPLPPASPMG